MNAKGYAQWKNMNEDFKQSGLHEDEYCRRKGFNYRWFERLNRDAKRYEQKHVGESASAASGSGLFIELEAEEEAKIAAEVQEGQYSAPLKLRYREVVFELERDFEESTFKRALRIVQEAF